MLTQANAAPYLIAHADGKGAIARYHLDQALVDQVLDDLAAGGAGGVSFSPWFMDQAIALGAGDLYLDRSGPGMSALARDNISNLLRAVKQRGFHFVQFAPQFYGAHNPRENACAGLWEDNWLLLVELIGLVQASGIPALIDVVPEFNGGCKLHACCYREDPEFARFTNIIWVNATAAYYPNGRPSFAFTMSFIPQNYDVVRDGFQGNPPVRVAPHIYRGEQQAVFEGLAGVGLAGHPWVVAECMTLSQPEDAGYAQDWVGFIEQTKQPVERFCPWQLDPRIPAGSPVQFNVFPPRAPQLWNALNL